MMAVAVSFPALAAGVPLYVNTRPWCFVFLACPQCPMRPPRGTGVYGVVHVAARRQIIPGARGVGALGPQQEPVFSARPRHRGQGANNCPRGVRGEPSLARPMPPSPPGASLLSNVGSDKCGVRDCEFSALLKIPFFGNSDPFLDRLPVALLLALLKKGRSPP